MKTASIFIGSTSLLASLAVAAPTRRSTNTIQVFLETGNGGDETRGFPVTLDQVFSTAGNRGLSQGVSAFIRDPTATCQAFTDNAATIPLGNPFTSEMEASFTDASNTEDAVPVGAFLCSASAEGLGQPQGGNGAPTGTAQGTARVQVEVDIETFVQSEVPLNSVFLTAQSIIGDSALELLLTRATGADVNDVSCQAFADAQATSPVGGPATAQNGGAVLSADRTSPATINAIVCSTSA
ncbi:MAG: hypothetical protein Q9164_001099 [Protoblastenia rupestris]